MGRFINEEKYKIFDELSSVVLNTFLIKFGWRKDDDEFKVGRVCFWSSIFMLLVRSNELGTYGQHLCRSKYPSIKNKTVLGYMFRAITSLLVRSSFRKLNKISWLYSFKWKIFLCWILGRSELIENPVLRKILIFITFFTWTTNNKPINRLYILHKISVKHCHWIPL